MKALYKIERLVCQGEAQINEKVTNTKTLLCCQVLPDYLVNS